MWKQKEVSSFSPGAAKNSTPKDIEVRIETARYVDFISSGPLIFQFSDDDLDHTPPYNSDEDGKMNQSVSLVRMTGFQFKTELMWI